MKRITRVIVAVIAAVLIAGSFQPNVGASAHQGDWSNKQKAEERANKVVYYSLNDLERLFANCFDKVYASWGKDTVKKNYKHNYKHKYYKKYHNKAPVVPEEQQPPQDEEAKEQDEKQNHDEQANETPVTEEETPKQEEKNETPITEEEKVQENENNNEGNEANNSYGLKDFEQQVVNLTNEERRKHGLQPLQVDPELSRVAREKSRDMQVNNYFDHTSPVYGSPFDMMRSFGITYTSAGENIAKGQRTPQEVVNAWMNSPGHRANILNGSYTHIGVGYIEQGNYWTQMFIRK